MRKIGKWIFEVTLAAALLLAMPGTVSYAEQAAGDMETLEMETSAAMEPEEEAGKTKDTNSCAHHKEHTEDCGYVPAPEDGEGRPCVYDCRICPIEKLTGALPDKVIEDNTEEVRAQLDEILSLYTKLNEEEQADISRCLELQEALDAANESMPLVTGDFEITGTGVSVTFTADECGDSCQGHIITQNAPGGSVQLVRILVKSGTHNITFSDLNLTAAKVGVMPDATMKLTISGTNLISASQGMAGIYVPVGATLVITEQSTGSLNVSGDANGAGIGGTYYDPSGEYDERGDRHCGTVEINGGSIYATGNSGSAGIGGAAANFSDKIPGNGGTVTINGGTVTATGGSDGDYYSGAGIGGGTFEGKYTGCGGTLTINGGHLTLTVGTHDPQWGAYGFGQGSGKQRPSGPCELTLADESCLTLTDDGITALDPNGTYSITGDPAGDMIVVPEGLVYNGNAHDMTGKIYIDDSKTGTTTLFGQTFNVTASADGWELQDLGQVINAGEYTATFRNGNKTISKTFTVEQSGTTFTADLIVRKGTEETKKFTADDTITVIAMPTASGQAPVNGPMMAASFNEPAGGQMALFVGDTQVSAPADADADGTYTMTANASDVLAAAGGPGKATLIAQFVENVNMAEAKAAAEVTITAVARVETGSTTTYHGSIETAWAAAKGKTATIRLLDDVTDSNWLTTGIGQEATNITFDGGEYTLTFRPDIAGSFVLDTGKLTIAGGKICGSDGLRLTGEILLRGGTFTGGEGNIVSGVPFRDRLGNDGDIYYAFYQDSQPVPLTTGNQYELTAGTYEVKECSHKGVCEYQSIADTNTHQMTCLACGYTEKARECVYKYTLAEGDTANHTATCTVCGREKTEEHNLKFTASVNGAVVTAKDACDVCGYHKTLGTVTFAFPEKLTYNDGQKIQWEASEGLELSTSTPVGISWICGESWSLQHAYADSIPLTDISNNDAPLPAADYQMRVQLFDHRGEKTNMVDISFTIYPAELAKEMITLTAVSATYNGTEQKPAVTIRQNGTTLTEGTDYEISYRRGGAATDDLASAGEVKIVAVGKGNYKGEAEKIFTINQAALEIKADNQTIIFGQDIAEGADNIIVTGLCAGDTLESVRLTPGATNVPGGAITASDAVIKNADNKDVTGSYAITYLAGRLTIGRAEGTLTVPETSISRSFGDGEFSLNCSTNGDGKISYASSNEDVASASADGNVLIKGIGETVITVSLGQGTNHTGGASQKITVTVVKAAPPVIMDETRNYTYLNGSNGAVTIDAAGKFPKDRGETKYTYATTDADGILSDVSVDDNGNLSYTVQRDRKIGNTASITVTAEMANYETATFTVKIIIVEKKVAELQAGSGVSINGSSILTYGQTISELKLANVAFVEQGIGTKVEGTLAWKDGSIVPNVKTTEAEWIFTPSDAAEYAEMTGTVPITVTKATPNVETPVTGAVIYDPSGKLRSMALTGGSATWTVGGSTVAVEGTWNWQSADFIPTVNNSGYAAVFTPQDTVNYETVEKTITVNVTRAVPYIAALPTAAGITYGDILKDSGLSGGTVQHGDGTGQAGSGSSSTQAVSGTFSWKEPAIKPAVIDSGSTEYEVVFTPSDTINYETAQCGVALTVQKAPNAPNMPGSRMNVSNGIEKVSDISLPDGWEWQEADRDIRLEAGVSVTAVAVYTAADKDNYENTEVTVTITVTQSSCDHVTGDILYTGEGEKAPACTEDGLGHRECAKCGSVVESAIVVKALGHAFTSEVTTKPTTDREGTRTYTCTRCGHRYTESVPKLPEETHGHSYTESVTRMAACTDAGVKIYTCFCGDNYVETIPALGHHYLSSMTRKPTTTAEGIMTYTCDRCGHSYTRAIGKRPGIDRPDDPATDQPNVPGIGSPEETRPDTGIPFIKGKDGKMGWDVIRAEEERAARGSIINIDMNGSTVVPGDIFERLRSRDIAITFDMGDGILWSVDGKSIIGDISQERPSDIDFSVKTGVNVIPADIVNNVTGESYSIQISLSYEGEFGFTAVLSINLGIENAGYTASLYYYNESIGKLEFMGSDEVSGDGTAAFAFTHASDYVIAIDSDQEEGGIPETIQPEGLDEAVGNSIVVEESPKTGQEMKIIWPIAAGIISLAGIAFVGVIVWKKKKRNQTTCDVRKEKSNRS